MSLFLVLVQIQFLGLLVAVLVLRASLPRSVLSIIRNNSLRLDGSFSKRRNWLENRSIDRCFVPIYFAAATLFLVTTLGGMATSELVLPWPNLAIEGSEDELLVLDYEYPNSAQSSETGSQAGDENHLNEDQSQQEEVALPWPLFAVYVVSSLMVCPLVIGSFHRKAIERYRVRANARFMDYYRSESVRIMENAAKAKSHNADSRGPEPVNH